MGLAIEYAKARGLTKITDKALEYAYETLGIEPEEEYEEYTGGGIYGMQNAFSPRNIIKSLGRNVLSGAAKKAISGAGLSSMIGPGLLLGGSLMLGRAFNPTRPGSRNYNPNLAGQIEYATRKGLIGTNPSSGLQQYGPNSVLSGQGVQSMFGTNDYQGQLDNKIGYFENRIALGKPYSEKNYQKALAEKADFFEEKQTIQENYRTGLQGAGGNVGTTDFTAADDNRQSYGKDTGSSTKGGSKGSKSSSSRSSRHGSGPGGLHSYSRGGIANINMNRGQLGETLYG